MEQTQNSKTEIKTAIIELLTKEGKLSKPNIAHKLGKTRKEVVGLINSLTKSGKLTKEKEGKHTLFSVSK